MLSSRWAFFSLPCSWLYEPVFHLDIFLINVSLSYDKHLLTKKWEDKWNHFWFLTYIIHNYEKKNSRKYNQYPLSVLCKITICSTFPLFHQSSIPFPESARLTQKVSADEFVLRVLSLLFSFLLMNFPCSQCELPTS